LRLILHSQRCRAPEHPWPSNLQQIQPTPTITNNVVLYTATFDVKNSANQLMTQMTGQVFFVTALRTMS
jgi:macrolide-specific efflux system membrane fusion protein